MFYEIFDIFSNYKTSQTHSKLLIYRSERYRLVDRVFVVNYCVWLEYWRNCWLPEWSIVQIRGSYNLVLFHSNRNDDAIVIAQVSLHTTIALCSFEPLSLWSLILRFVKVLNKPKSEGSICFCHKRGVLKNTIATYRKMQKCNRWNFNSLPCKKIE